jgi:hypothetical protein
MVMGEKGGLLAMASEGRLTNGSAQLKGFPVPLENLNIFLAISESDVEIKEIALPIAGGEINATGRILEYQSEQKFLGKLELEKIQLQQLTEKMEIPAQIEGSLNGRFKATGKGLSKGQLEASLAGEGLIRVDDGRIKDVNILKIVLSKLSFIPNLVDQVQNKLPDRYKEKLKENDTILEKVEIDLRMHNNALVINQAQLIADGFMMIARGNCDFDQNLTLDADLYIPSDLSASMVAASKELKYLLDERQRIHIPLSQYRGKLARLKMFPNVGDLGKEIIRNRGKDEIRKLLNKALDFEGEDAQDSSDPDASNQGGPVQPPEREVRPEGALIENILDMIPIFE